MINYEEYIAEQINKSISYSEYVAQQIDRNISYGMSKNVKRKEKIKNLFK